MFYVKNYCNKYTGVFIKSPNFNRSTLIKVIIIYVLCQKLLQYIHAGVFIMSPYFNCLTLIKLITIHVPCQNLLQYVYTGLFAKSPHFNRSTLIKLMIIIQYSRQNLFQYIHECIH